MKSQVHKAAFNNCFSSQRPDTQYRKLIVSYVSVFLSVCFCGRYDVDLSFCFFLPSGPKPTLCADPQGIELILFKMACMWILISQGFRQTFEKCLSVSMSL